MSLKPIKNVLVLGASGSVGPMIVEALRSHPQGFTVSILTRPGSFERTRSMFPDLEIKIFKADYSSPDVTADAFKASFENQDAIISATATFTVSQQIAIIDAAIAVKSVQRFIPSEYGIDTSKSDSLRENVPVAYIKTDIVEYLKDHESSLSWSAVCTGAFFDWVFQFPGMMGWDIPRRAATIFDGGDVPYEATNIAQIGVAVAAVLSATPSPGFADGTGKGLSMIEITKNKYVYVNSFTTTQNTVLGFLEKQTSTKFKVEPANRAEVAKDAIARAAKSVPGFRPTSNLDYADGVVEMIFASIYGNGNLNHFSETKGLWNDALGLQSESVEESVKGVVEYWNKKEGKLQD
jgi:hypothetical protein